MSKLILSAFIDEYSDNLIEQLEFLKEQNIEFTEIRHINGKNISSMTLDEVKEYKNKMDNYGVKISSIGSPIGKIRLDEDFDAHLEMCKSIFEKANILNTNLVRIFSFYPPENKNIQDFKEEVIGKLKKIIDLSKEYNLTLCHENEAKIYGESPDNCLEIIESFDNDLKCVFDMGNFVLDGFKPFPDAYDKLKKHIKYFHIKDALYEGAIVPAGKGEASIEQILREYLKDAKEDTYVSLEPHLQTFDGLNSLVGKKFDNPYKYKNQKEAFNDGLNKLREILNRL